MLPPLTPAINCRATFECPCGHAGIDRELMQSQISRMTGAIQKWGNNLDVRIPLEAVRHVRAARPRYHLVKMLRDMNAANGHEAEWGKAEGREV